MSFRTVLSTLIVALLCVIAPARAHAKSYVHIRITGVINPVKARYVERALARAEAEQAELVLVSIDTPGGLVSSMEKIASSFTNSRIPIVAFVEPTSAQATSAGAFILLASDVAAMAPHTRVGAAHPVGGEGKDLGNAMNEKATNSLVSLAKSLAARRGRPEGFAESIVRTSASYTAEEAKAAVAIEFIANDATDLFNQLHGRELVFRGEKRALATRDLARTEVALSWPEQLLDVIADPTIASMLLTLGILGILYELSSPGIGASGIVGLISLLSGLAAMSVLPLELGGILLLLVGFAAIGIEIKAQTHGVLAFGGVVSLVIGALFLVDRGSYFGAVQLVDWRIFGPFIAIAAVAFILLARVAMRAQKVRFQMGAESMTGRHGSAKTSFAPAQIGFSGSVFVDGARWTAISDAPIDVGEGVEVVEVLKAPTRLKVKRIEGGAA